MLSGEYLFTERDLTAFFLPPRQFWVQEMASGTFPLWNPYFNSGHPLFATLQPGVIYPFSVFYLIFPFHHVFNYIIIVHFALGGIFTFWLMRAQNASREAAYVSAVVFMFGGYLMSVHNVLSTLLSVIWTPLFFLVFFAGLVKNDLRWAAGAGLVGVAMFLGGGVEVCYLVFGLVLLMVLFPWMALDEGRWPPLKKRLLHYLVFCAVFFGVSAVQLIPFLELGRFSLRASGVPYYQAVTWSLHPRDLIEFFTPDLYGYRNRGIKAYWENQNWLKTFYLGSAPFLLSWFFFRQRNRKTQGYLIVVLISMLLAFGGNSLFYPYLFEYFPFMDKWRYPVKFIFMTVFAVCLAAGFGYDLLKKEIQNQSRFVARFARYLLMAGAGFMILFGVLSSYDNQALAAMDAWGWTTPDFNDSKVNLFNFKRLICFTSLYCLLFFLAAKNNAGKKYLFWAVLALLTLDVFFANHRFYDFKKTEQFMASSSNMDFILSQPGRFRVLLEPHTLTTYEEIMVVHGKNVLDLLKDKMQPGLGLERKIFQAWGPQVTVQSRYKTVYDFIRYGQARPIITLLNMLNVKYLISVFPIKYSNFKLVHMNVPGEMTEALVEKKTVKIYENLEALPRAFLVGECRVMSNLKNYIDAMTGPDFQPERHVLLDEEPKGFSCEEKKNAAAGNVGGELNELVEFTDYQSASFELKVKNHARKFLFLSEAYYPGWKATVDGRPAEILRANFVFRALLLEPGEHAVRFEYDPNSFKIGAWITAISLVGCFVFMIKKRRTVRRPPEENRPEPPSPKTP